MIPGDSTRRGFGRETLYGQTLGRGALCGEYEVERSLGSGGCGTVYAARHRILRRHAAVKVLHRDLAESMEMVGRFVREAKAVNVIRHPNIVDIYEFGRLPDGRPYHVMELLEGPSLRALVEERGRLAPAEALEILAPVCEALQAAHEVGVIHRDLKASNVVVLNEGARRTVKLLDFGIAKFTQLEAGDVALTASSEQLGTPQSMAPEQFRGGPIDARTDVYALGLLLYYVLTGRHAFSASDPLELQRLHLEAPPPQAAGFAAISVQVDQVIARALAKDPAARHPTARAFLEDLEAAAGRPGGEPRAERAVTGRDGVAVFLELRVPDEHATSLSEDALLDAIGFAEAAAEETLLAAGFVLALQTATAFLGVLLLHEDAAERSREREAALAAARTLRARIVARLPPTIHANLCLHQGRVLAHRTAAGTAIIGGALIRIEEWAPRRDVSGLCATADLAASLASFDGPVV
jgi:tRNA A-37 threonylcarbamoyl transferase component Bud32